MARQFTDEERERMTRGGRWLRQQRKEAGFEHGTEFADVLGIKQVRLSAYERGLYPVPEAVARDIARALRLTEWEVWRGLQLPLPRELDDDEAIRRALKLRPEIMENVPEIVEKATGRKLDEKPPFNPGSSSSRPTDTRTGEKRRKSDPGKESAG
jgi:transcriptional regulator with XRE-family HTH domain